MADSIENMTPILDADGVTIIGYETTDGLGTTTFYDLLGTMTGYSTVSNYDDGLGFTSTDTFTYDANGNLVSSTHSNSDGYSNTQVTLRDSSGNITGRIDSGTFPDGYSWEYNYDSNGFFLGGTDTDGVTTWTYDSNWNIISQSVDTSAMTPILDADGTTIIGYETTDGLGTTTFYDLLGAMTGYQTVTNFDDGLGFTSTNTSTFDANSMLIGTSYSDSNGHSSSNSTVTLMDEFGNITGYIDSGSWSDGITSNSWEYNYDSAMIFLGGTDTDGITIRTYDSNWNIISETVDTSAMTPILDTDGVTVIGYESDDGLGTTTFYDLLGTMTGYQTVTNFDDGLGFTSTNTSTFDANSMLIGTSYSDSNGHSSSNSTVTLMDEFGNITGYIDSGSWSDGITSNSWEYNYDSAMIFLGGTDTDGITIRTYDSNWNIISETGVMTPILDADGVTIIGHETTDDLGTTTFYDLLGIVTGYSTVSNYDDGLGFTSTSTSTFDENWNLISSAYSDSTGHSSSNSQVTLTDGNGIITGYIDNGTWSDGVITNSWVFNFDSNWNFLGGTETDGVTTKTYDSNWNIIEKSFDTSAMTPILDADGVTIIGHEASYDWGTAAFYGLHDPETGYNTVSNYDNGLGFTSTSTSTYDVNWNLISSTFSDSNGNSSSNSTVTLTDGSDNITGYIDTGSWSDSTTTNSWEYNFDSNWNFLGGTSTDGITTWTYDSNWNVIDSAISDIIAPSNLGNGILLQNDGGLDGTADVGDTLVFDFSEPVGNKIAIESFFSDNSIYGADVTFDWLPTDSTLNVTLGVNETYDAGSEVVITGVQDIAGNSADITFSFI